MTGKERQILIVPVGPVDTGTLAALGPALRVVFQFPVKTGTTLSVPVEAYDYMRRQYHSTFLLNTLIPLRSPDVYRVLGVIDEDLFVPKLNFVFGEADMESGVAVISLARLRPEIYGHPPDNRLFFERAVKEAVHELGHTFGMGHCPDVRCIMFFSNSLEDTDRKGPSFCPACKGKLTRGTIV